MFFGVGIPILFPIAVIDFIVIWMFERYFIARVYRLTPSLNKNLTNHIVSWLSWTPILLLLNGFWMVSNRQMFNNVVNKISYSSENMSTSHTVFSTYSPYALPMLLVGLLLMILVLCRVELPKAMMSWALPKE